MLIRDFKQTVTAATWLLVVSTVNSGLPSILLFCTHTYVFKKLVSSFLHSFFFFFPPKAWQETANVTHVPSVNAADDDTDRFSIPSSLKKKKKKGATLINHDTVLTLVRLRFTNVWKPMFARKRKKKIHEKLGMTNLFSTSLFISSNSLFSLLTIIIYYFFK